MSIANTWIQTDNLEIRTSRVRPFLVPVGLLCLGDCGINSGLVCSCCRSFSLSRHIYGFRLSASCADETATNGECCCQRFEFFHVRPSLRVIRVYCMIRDNLNLESGTNMERQYLGSFLEREFEHGTAGIRVAH